MQRLKTLRWIVLLAISASSMAGFFAFWSRPSDATPPEIAQARPGSLDATFGTGGFATSFGGLSLGLDTVIQPDGKIVIVGINRSQPGFLVARHNTNGSLDTSFDSDGQVETQIAVDSEARAVALQSDRRILVAGSVGGSGPSGVDYDFAVVRYTPNGSLDTTFGGDGIVTTAFRNSQDTAIDLAVQSDGKIVVGGYSDDDGGQFAGVFSRYNANGSLDATFDGDGKLVMNGDDCLIPAAIVLQPDDKMIVAGNTCIAPQDFKIFRFLTDGSLDTTFDGDGKVTTSINVLDEGPSSITLQSDGKIVVSGHTSPTLDHYDIAVIRYNPNGSLDASFGDDGIVTTRAAVSQAEYAVAVQHDGKVVVAGRIRLGSPTESGILVRYNRDGSPDLSFGSDGVVITTIGFGGSYYGIALQSDGKIVTVGARWDGNSVTFLVARYIGRTSPNDFDGDGRTDVAAFRPSVGQWWLNQSSDGLLVQSFGTLTDQIAPSDFTGDGKTDIAIFRPATGEWFVLRSEDSSFYSFPFGATGDIPVPSDFDGDGKTDPTVFRPSTSTWYTQRSTGGTTIQTFGAVGDRPVPADYDGDGKADIAVYRPSLGQWWMNRSTAGLIVHTFGNSADRNVPGDYTGDGKADVAIWRPSTGEWFVLRSEDASFYSFPFGISTDLPVPGDYDGDGRTDAGVFRPSNATWYLNRSTNGTLIQGFGLSTDVPVPSVFVR